MTEQKFDMYGLILCIILFSSLFAFFLIPEANSRHNVDEMLKAQASSFTENEFLKRCFVKEKKSMLVSGDKRDDYNNTSLDKDIYEYCVYFNTSEKVDINNNKIFQLKGQPKKID